MTAARRRPVLSLGAAAAGGWAIDQLLGEPPTRWHPVARFGTAMHALEQRTYRPGRVAGAAHLAVGVAAAAGVGLVAERLVGRRLAVVAATAVSVAGRMLATEARAVLTSIERGDLPTARLRVQSLVGRETSELDEPELVRAVIESLAENTVDAVVAPLCWAAVGGAPAVLAHRAVNTLDAMVGHRSERYLHFGWAAARADDVMNFVPARIAAIAVGALRPRRAGPIARAVIRDAPAHPSPNGGVIEAAVAGALGVRLGGENRYGGHTERRGELGDGERPTATDGRRAIALTSTAGALVATVLAVLAVPRRRRGTDRSSRRSTTRE